MNSKVTATLGFIFGGLGGWFAASHLLKQKYQDYANSEIESVKAAFRFERDEARKKNEEAFNRPNPNSRPKPDAAERRTYRKLVRESGYSPDIEKPAAKKPAIIDEDEVDFDGEKGFEVSTLNYYKDNVLTDEDDKPLDDETVTEYLGSTLWRQDFLTATSADEHADVVYVRNFELRTDFEIVWNDITYAEFIGDHPEVVNN